jgi:2-keto-4-pentenoate hydratase/2-oxohepta-3-ene-1,7-dioic acid hydratase in catechol pathway
VTGTPGKLNDSTSLALFPGDVISVSIDAVGTMQNRVVIE